MERQTVKDSELLTNLGYSKSFVTLIAKKAFLNNTNLFIICGKETETWNLLLSM